MDKIELSKEVKTVMAYIPSIIMSSELSLSSIIMSSRVSLLRCEALDELDEEFKRYWRRTVPNNYLKMHGYPMKRRGC